jgi:hypothetical protein
LIWDELNHYKEFKQILGNHPIFADDILKESVNKMDTADAIKRRNNLRSYISKETKKLPKITEDDKLKVVQDKIKVLNQELNLLEEKLQEKK